MDTNVFLHAADRDSPFHSRCEELVEGWRTQSSAWFSTWGVCYEFLRVATHPGVFRSPWSALEAWSFLEALFDSPGFGLITPTERHRVVASEVFQEIPYLSGNIMHDTHTAVLMREHGLKRIFTRDTDFHRSTFLEPIDPMGSIALNTQGGDYVYRSSKAAVNAVVKSMAVDLHPRRIAVLTVHPGWVRTSMGAPQAPLSAEQSVAAVCRLLGGVTLRDSGKFLNYDGTELPW